MRDQLFQWLKTQIYLPKDLTDKYIQEFDNLPEDIFASLLEMYDNDLKLNSLIAKDGDI